jgi:hypothetical protein
MEFMGGYQSDSTNSGGPSVGFWKTKGFLSIEADIPYPPGVKNDVWVIDGSGYIGNSIYVETGDILYCRKDNPGGDFLYNDWVILPHKYASP